MRSEVVSGVQERADAFLKKVFDSGEKSLNVYVSFLNYMNKHS
jgi:hypothetical protein